MEDKKPEVVVLPASADSVLTLNLDSGVLTQGTVLWNESMNTMMCRLDHTAQCISFYTDGKERLRITKDGEFIVNSIMPVDIAEEASKIYYALRDVLLGRK